MYYKTHTHNVKQIIGYKNINFLEKNIKEANSAEKFESTECNNRRIKTY